MTPSAIPGFLTKTEVAELYGRSHRSLTRDISSAVRVKNVEVLKHLKILTDDEKIREGTDVTLDQIQDLSNRGLSPTWYIERAWAAKRYGLQPEPPVPEPRAKTTRRPNADSAVIVSDESGLVRSLEEQIKTLRDDKEKLYSELTIKNEQIREANNRTRESNVLMKELQTLLADVQQRALLPLPSQPRQTTNSRSPASSDVIDDRQSQPAAVQDVAKAPTSKTRQRSGPDGKRKSKATSPAPSKSSADSPSTKRPTSRWFPTFKRIFTRRP
jgi:hypothetical protein